MKINFRKEFAEEEKKASSPFIAFVHIILGRKLNHTTIKKWYKELIPKDDYSAQELNEIIDWLVNVSNSPLDERGS